MQILEHIRFSRRQWLGAGVVAGAALSAGYAKGQSAPAPLERLTPPSGPIPAAILLDQNATVIDFAGPWEALQDASVAQVQGFNLYTVAARPDPIIASAGLRILPHYTLDNAPQPKVVVMGAQSGSRQPSETTQARIDWIRHVAPDADIVMSVCTGAFLLARTGLLDGLNATTHHQFYDAFAHDFPRVNLVRNRRFVDNGKFISGGGLTSGVDAALHIVARYYGMDAARQSAAYMEHGGDGWISGIRA